MDKVVSSFVVDDMADLLSPCQHAASWAWLDLCVLREVGSQTYAALVLVVM